jgi:ankyrin repeat protein
MERFSVNTDMYNAVNEENLDKIRRYMNAGFDINENYKESKTYGACNQCNLLYFAVQEFKRDAVEYLLDHGADVNLTDSDGCMPIHLIATKRTIRAPRRLGPKWHTDKFEEMGDPLDIARLLIKAGADLNVQTRDTKRTPLELAMHDPAMVKLLLESGSDVHKTFHGEAILLLEGIHFGGKEVMHLLIDAGADPELKDKTGLNALENAIHFKVTEAIPILEEEKEARILEAQVAFAMGAHNRLGNNSSVSQLEDGVVEMILKLLKLRHEMAEP